MTPVECIDSNSSLTSLAVLGNPTSVSGDVIIGNNRPLTRCENDAFLGHRHRIGPGLRLMRAYALGFPEVGRTDIGVVGGKGANLGELSRLEGIRVPDDDRPLRPLGLSLFQLTAARPMYAAGGRLFVDVTKQLASPASRDLVLGALGRHDPLIQDALTTLLERGDFIESGPGDSKAPVPVPSSPGQIEADPAIVADLIARSRASIEALQRDIRTKSGTDLLDFILEDIHRLKQSLTEPRSMGAILAGMNAATWINEQLMAWLGGARR